MITKNLKIQRHLFTKIVFSFIAGVGAGNEINYKTDAQKESCLNCAYLHCPAERTV